MEHKITRESNPLTKSKQQKLDDAHKKVIVLLPPWHLYKSTSFYYVKLLVDNGFQVIAIGSSSVCNSAHQELGVTESIVIEWWRSDIGYILMANVSIIRDVLGMSCQVHSPHAAGFPLGGLILGEALAAGLPIWLYDIAKPPLSYIGYLQDLNDRIRHRHSALTNQSLFWKYCIPGNIGLILYFNLMRQKERIVTTSLKIKSRNTIYFLNSVNGHTRFRDLSRITKFISSVNVVTWCNTDEIFYRGIGYANVKTREHPAAQHLDFTTSDQGKCLGVFPTDIVGQSPRGRHVVVDEYVNAINKLCKLYAISRCLVKPHPSTSPCDNFIELLTDRIMIRSPSIVIKTVPKEEEILDILPKCNYILVDSSSVAWYNSAIFNRPSFVIKSIFELQSKELLNYRQVFEI
jgi:hypothetical protein